MSRGERLVAVARHPTVVMVMLGIALYPLVREERSVRVLRLTAEQDERALDRERRRSDAPETLSSRAGAREEALDEEALAEFAIAEELHRRDDGLRLALAQAARHELARTLPTPTPTDAELRALASEVPVEALIDARVVRTSGAHVEVHGVTLSDLEARFSLRHLPAPTHEEQHLSASTSAGESLAITLSEHHEDDASRMARLRPELERRFARQQQAKHVQDAVRALRAAYDRVESP